MSAVFDGSAQDDNETESVMGNHRTKTWVREEKNRGKILDQLTEVNKRKGGNFFSRRRQGTMGGKEKIYGIERKYQEDRKGPTNDLISFCPDEESDPKAEKGRKEGPVGG